MIILYPSPSNSEASIKYFLVQALASVILIMGGIFITKFIPISYFNRPNVLISMALGVKLGMAPTHFWFPQVIELINWLQGVVLLTWQKIAPLILLFSSSNSLVIFFLIVLSCLFGAAGGFNVNSLKKIIAYSSVAHLAWIASASLLNFKIFFIYFLAYSLISVSVILLFSILRLSSIRSINTIKQNKLIKIFIFLNLISLGGIPPLLGIFSKIIVILCLVNFSIQELITSAFLIITSIVTLFFYTKLTYSYLIINNIDPSPSTYFSPASSLSGPINLFMAISILGNLIALPLVLLI